MIYSGVFQRKRRKWLWLPVLFVLIALLSPLVPSVFAQDYAFSVPTLRMQVYVQPDASARIVYDITFANHPDAKAIDIVDIGTPTKDYTIADMQASIDGHTLKTIRKSEYIDTGVEIHLDQYAIPGGKSGTLHVAFTMPNMVFQDTTNADRASLRITPTWFDEELVKSPGTIEIAIHMLPNIQPNELLYQDEKMPFTEKALFQGHAVAYWKFNQVMPTKAYMVGISFPKRGMTRVVTMSAFQLLVKWLEEHPTVVIILMGATMILTGILFFRFTGGTGISVFFVLLMLIWCASADPGNLLCVFPFILLLIPVNEWFLRKRKSKYLPPIAQVEGGGIKRGLTAPEAAVLLEMPLHKVLTLVIFGLLKKGVLQQVQDNPLTVDVAVDFQGQDISQRLKTASTKGIALHNYEHPFLDLIEKNPKKPVQKLDFSKPMKVLIEQTVGRVKGFDLSDTQDYYRAIVKRAVEEAKEIGDIPEREKTTDRNLEWILMGDNYGTVFDSRGYRYRPIWTRPSSSSSGSSSSDAGGPAVEGTTSFTDVAASFAGWTETTMSNLADTIIPGSLSMQKSDGGFINLSGVDKVTGDIFEAINKSSGSSGGGCACAGCACACACAGGGR